MGPRKRAPPPNWLLIIYTPPARVLGPMGPISYHIQSYPVVSPHLPPYIPPYMPPIYPPWILWFRMFFILLIYIFNWFFIPPPNLNWFLNWFVGGLPPVSNQLDKMEGDNTSDNFCSAAGVGSWINPASCSYPAKSFMDPPKLSPFDLSRRVNRFELI